MRTLDEIIARMTFGEISELIKRLTDELELRMMQTAGNAETAKGSET